MLRKFLVKASLFSLPLALISYVYVRSFEWGRLDFYYGKLSSGKQHSLILGNSRAGRGIVPAVFNERLFSGKQKMFNFAFTLLYSPYGPVYKAKTLQKIRPDVKDGIFILSVDPSSISTKTSEPNDARQFSENKSFLAHVRSVTSRPNLDYIFFGQETYYQKLISNVWGGHGYLHDDGWLETYVATDSLIVTKRIERKLAIKSFASDFNFSVTRMNSLKKLIGKLSQHGQVYLVRLPMIKVFTDRQKKSFPDFEEKMVQLSRDFDVLYKSFENEGHRFEFVDGSHLTSQSAIEFSNELVDWIIQTNKQDFK